MLIIDTFILEWQLFMITTKCILLCLAETFEPDLSECSFPFASPIRLPLITVSPQEKKSS